jgi:prepilin-type N-terminal cleavage/methylation domain-containing protein
VKRAFTLIELLVTIAIIAIVCAILFPVLSSAKRNAWRATCQNDLRQINVAVRLYADEHGDLLTLVSTNHSPDVWTDYRLWIGSYVGLPGPPSPKDKLFACPADSYYWDDVRMTAQGRHQQSKYRYSSYAFNAGNLRADYPFKHQFPGIAGRKLNTIKSPAKTVLVTEWCSLDPYSWHQSLKEHPPQNYGVNNARCVVSFVDGHVNYIPMYWDANTATAHIEAWYYDPPDGYDYKWSGD